MIAPLRRKEYGSMKPQMTSRERMLEALSCRQPDYAPCSFMIFAALRSQCKDEFEFVDKQLALGMDPAINIVTDLILSRENTDQADLGGLPVRYDPQVVVRQWREDLPNERYPLLHKEYSTPAGALHTVVARTEDYQQGDRVPLFDDFVIPRSRKRLVARPEDLEALKCLLVPPSADDIAALRERARASKAFAAQRGVLVQARWGSVVDTACWLAGITELVLMGIDQPDFLEDLLEIIETWNRSRMAVMLEMEPDLFIRRGWYETSELWSPAMYRRFILPGLRRDAEMAHQAGARFGYIMSTAQTPLADQFLEAEIDALIGLDPVQGKGVDFAALKRKIGQRVCLWGGVNGFVTMELGAEDEVRAEVRRALEVLGPGGFVLSPVDNVTQSTDLAWRNVRILLDEWRKGRAS
jgi:uroporphyrinogen-III decarboxylase